MMDRNPLINAIMDALMIAMYQAETSVAKCPNFNGTKSRIGADCQSNGGKINLSPFVQQQPSLVTSSGDISIKFPVHHFSQVTGTPMGHSRAHKLGCVHCPLHWLRC